MNNRPTNHELMQESLLKPLNNYYNIDFVNYVRYDENELNMICSTIYDDELDGFMNDEFSALPLEICQENSILSWADYCSDSFMDTLRYRYQYSPNGAAIILKHHDFAEHIELGSSNINANISKLVRSDSQVKKEIVAFIRTHINLSQGLYQTKVYKNHIPTAATKDPHYHLESELTKKNRHFIYGKLGVTELSQIELDCWVNSLTLASIKAVGAELNIAPKTVEFHLRNVRLKLGVKYRSDLYHMARNNFLI